MRAEAVAAGTQKPAAAARVAARTHPRLDTYRLPAVRREQAPQSLLELDLRLPAEDLAGARDVRLPHLGIVDRQRLVHDLALRARELEDALRQLQDRELLRVADVD